MTSGYAYTKKDLLLSEPYHYHYTQYEGAPLLAAYRKDRLSAVERFQGRLAGYSLTDASRVGTDEDPEAPPFAGIFERAVETGSELAAAADWVTRGGNVSNAELVTFVDVFTRKFEVSKRLRSRYAAGLRLDARDSAPIDAYCHLALLLAVRLSVPDRLWRLNALLKLNDLLISTDTKSVSPAAASSAVEAIHIELEMVLQMAAQKEVPVP